MEEKVLEEIISCSKEIVDPPKKQWTTENRHYRNGFSAESIDGKYRFKVFMRQSKEFPEDFSIGLIGEIDGREVTILRYNGPHGDVKKELFVEDSWHFEYHIHRFDPDLSQLVPFSQATYGSYQEALADFLKRCGFRNYESYFPYVRQSEFDFG